MKPIYLDYNATTPIAKEVADAMVPFLYGGFGNPSSSHAYGIEAKQAVERARASVARMIGADPDEILFTSGGSEANNLAIQGSAFALRERGNHIVTSSIEHPAVLEVCGWLQTQGFEVSYLPVDEEGFVDPAVVERALKPSTILVTIMLANNEIGTLEPVEEIARICRAHGVRVHTDAAQAIGKVPVSARELGVDLLSIAGHKLYAPKGIGALYVRRGTNLARLIHGAGHERGLRAGTENVLEIVGLGKAAELVTERLSEYQAKMRAARDRLEEGILRGARQRGFEVRFNGPRQPEAVHRNGLSSPGTPAGAPPFPRRLPNTASVSFKGIDASTLLAELTGVAASAGAACHADKVEVSHVLAAMGVAEEYARGTIRFSVGRETSTEEIDCAVTQIVEAAARLYPRAWEESPGERGEGWESWESGAPAEAAWDRGVGDRRTEEIRLTRFTRGLGCACKLPVAALREALRAVPYPSDPSVLVGLETSDDAAVYSLSFLGKTSLGGWSTEGNQGGAGLPPSVSPSFSSDPAPAVVQTVDFFTPIVDNPYDFGRVAAANALSDLFAMGAKPAFALAIVAFPLARLPLSALKDMLRGVSEKAREAGIPILGGHTVDGSEPLLGLAATGFAEAGGIVRNRGARPGDLLYLTKPLGTGVLSTALKRGLLCRQEEEELVNLMATLNDRACRAMVAVGVSAATDVTGFGLLGHLRGMLEADRDSQTARGDERGGQEREGTPPALEWETGRLFALSARLYAKEVPVLAKARELAAEGLVPGGSRANRRWMEPFTKYDDGVPEETRTLLSDAQTSGGLLIAVSPARASLLEDAFRKQGCPFWRIGEVLAPGEYAIEVT